MSNDYRALERAYSERRARPGAELMVSLKGRIEERPSIESSLGVQPTLVVETFERAIPGETCEGEIAAQSLTNTRWRPIRIGEDAVIVSEGEREPWIYLEPRSKGVTGSGGCNRFAGDYESEAGTLRFGPLAATKMACPSLDTETQFFRALESTRRYRIRGRILELLDGRERLLARLEERNL